MSAAKQLLVVTKRAQAIEAGAARYFTGNACRHGHTAERYTLDGYCVICRTERQRQERADLVARRTDRGGR